MGDLERSATGAMAVLPPADLALLRSALEPFTVSAVHDVLGLAGQAAHARNDLAGVARALRHGSDERLTTLITLFLTGRPVPDVLAGRALHPLPLATAVAGGLVHSSAGETRARVEIRPYAESGEPAAPAAPWWVVSDLGSDVRPGPLEHHHVLGVGAASLTLAQATPRQPVDVALDIGTGCGIQALHLAGHARRVVATDISSRALRFAATTAALSDQHWDLRQGSMLEPVATERFDLVVANPPFVVSPGADSTTERYDYRDSGWSGDEACAQLVRTIPRHLTPGGVGQLLANWIVPADGEWRERVAGWLGGSGCDAWVWQREVADPAEYVSLWLRDAGEQPGTERWRTRYDAWLDWFAACGVVAVGMGLITMWRCDEVEPTVVLEDVPQPLEQPAGAHLPGWIARQRWLARHDDHAVADTQLRLADGVVLTRDELCGTDGWVPAALRLRQTFGMRWDVDVDAELAAVLGACDGGVSVAVPLRVLAAALGAPTDEVVAAAMPALRDLISRGFLLPPEVGRPPEALPRRRTDPPPAPRMRTAG